MCIRDRYIIHRRSEFRGEEKLVQSLKQKKNVEFVLDSKVTALNGTDSLESLIVQNVETKKEQTIPVSGVFVAIGQMPQNEKFAGMVAVSYTHLDVYKRQGEFHAHLGYRMVGEFQKCGYKFHRWYNMIWMEKIIGEHTDEQPSPIPFSQLEDIHF